MKFHSDVAPMTAVPIEKLRELVAEIAGSGSYGGHPFEVREAYSECAQKLSSLIDAAEAAPTTEDSSAVPPLTDEEADAMAEARWTALGKNMPKWCDLAEEFKAQERAGIRACLARFMELNVGNRSF